MGSFSGKFQREVSQLNPCYSSKQYTNKQQLSEFFYIYTALLGLNMYKQIDIDRDKLTIMGVRFSDLKTLENTANAIGSNMFEGFKPNSENIKIIRDYLTGTLSLDDVLKYTKEKTYV